MAGMKFAKLAGKQILKHENTFLVCWDSAGQGKFLVDGELEKLKDAQLQALIYLVAAGLGLTIMVDKVNRFEGE